LVISRIPDFRGKTRIRGVSDFDKMGIVVDWIDACRKGDLASLLDLYADDACLECQCDGSRLYRGRSELEAYWQPQLGVFSTVGVRLDEITPSPHGIEIEYSIAGSLRVRATFRFSSEGKIVRTRCEPALQDEPNCAAC
jgi:SnoaL-like domain